jgi:hypothetical protein
MTLETRKIPIVGLKKRDFNQIEIKIDFFPKSSQLMHAIFRMLKFFPSRLKNV